MRILITGFEPFGSDSYNPSGEVLALLPDCINGSKIILAVLPVARREAQARVLKLIEEEKPDCVISLGLAAGRKGITIERTAVNVDDFRIRDNAGEQPHDEKISEEGPDAYFTSLPFRKIEAALKEAGIPVSVSESAGTFVCNHVFYAVRHACALCHPQIRSGFIHLPCADEMDQENVFSMPLKEMAKAVITAVCAL
jgi:pyroglutamyl-peptidase